MLNPDDIAFIFSNPPDINTGESRGYTIGRILSRLPNGKAARIARETIPDHIGDQLAKVMEERAKKEYGGQLVTPSGDPLTDTLLGVQNLEKPVVGDQRYKDYNPRDISGVEERVTRKDRHGV